MIELREYQKRLIEGARDEMRKGNRRVVIVAPCGAGKTMLAAYMGARHADAGGRTLFLAHRRELIEQAAGTFERVGIGRKTASSGVEICVGTNTRVMSVQTAQRRLEALKANPPTMIICDECHHAKAKTWQDVLSAFPEAFVIGLTATPIRLDGKGLRGTFDAMVQQVDAQWLIDNGYLSAAKYYSVPTIDTGGLHIRRGEYVQSEIEAIYESKASTIYGDIVREYREKADGLQAICYCPSVEISKRFAERFTGDGISAAHMDGDMGTAERESVTGRFRAGELRVICNVDLLGEGFDVPDCACSILARPTASLSLYIQQAMRCMRYREGKTAIILDHAANWKKHGLPEDERAWTLDGKQKRERKAGEAVNIRECPECYAVLRAGEEVCPECGHVFEKQERKAPETDERAKLVEIERKARRMEEGRARSYEDLLKIAEERGYKPGWAYYRAKARGWTR